MKTLLMFVILAATFESVASVYCSKKTTDIWGYTSTTYMYCSSSCCGTEYSRYCCYSYDSAYTATVTYGTGSIVGGVVGSIIFVIVVVVIIVCICKHNNRSRVSVINTPARNQPTVVVSSNQNQSYPPPPAYPPPAYPPQSTNVTAVY